MNKSLASKREGWGGGGVPLFFYFSISNAQRSGLYSQILLLSLFPQLEMFTPWSRVEIWFPHIIVKLLLFYALF